MYIHIYIYHYMSLKYKRIVHNKGVALKPDLKKRSGFDTRQETHKAYSHASSSCDWDILTWFLQRFEHRLQTCQETDVDSCLLNQIEGIWRTGDCHSLQMNGTFLQMLAKFSYSFCCVEELLF